MPQGPTLEPIDERVWQQPASGHRTSHKNPFVVIGIIALGVLVCGAFLLFVAIRFTARENARIRESDRAARAAQSESDDRAMLTPVRVEDLLRAYDENEVAAASRFDGKRVAVSGTIEKVGKDIMNTNYVLIRGDRVWGVQCMFDDSHENRLAGLFKGAKITVVGTSAGKMGHVLLRDCDFR